MAKGKLSDVKETFQRQTKIRRVLQPLQEAVDEHIINEKSMVNPNDETLSRKEKLPKSKGKLKTTEKENVTAVRRSKRAAVASVTYAESPDVSMTAKTKSKSVSKAKKSAKSKKESSTAVKKSEKTKLNQTKLDFPPVTADTVLKENLVEFKSDESEKCALNTSTTEINEDSGFDPNCGVSDQSPMNSTVISTSVDVKNTMKDYDRLSSLACDTPPLSYWRDLAEQRRIALEKALHENELLHDQLTVLEAENSQLKELVKEAENLAQVLKAVIE